MIFLSLIQSIYKYYSIIVYYQMKRSIEILGKKYEFEATTGDALRSVRALADSINSADSKDITAIEKKLITLKLELKSTALKLSQAVAGIKNYNATIETTKNSDYKEIEKSIMEKVKDEEISKEVLRIIKIKDQEDIKRYENKIAQYTLDIIKFKREIRDLMNDIKELVEVSSDE